MDQLDSKIEKLEFGEWRLDRLLGSGAFGKVLLMSNRHTGEKIAVKKAHRDSPFAINNNWDKELEILHQLNHPGKLYTALLFIKTLMAHWHEI